MRIALFQPEIPQNTGTLLRLSACMGWGVDIIEPCGFIWNHPHFKRAVMDYLPHVDVRKFADFPEFLAAQSCRVIPCIVGGKTSYYDFGFEHTDTILFGRESDGIPHHLIEEMESIHIPMPGKLRSLNLAIAASMVVGEGARQMNLHTVTP